MTFAIGKHRIEAGCPPFIIAELSGNHNGSLERALEIVDAAADAGAHAIKMQTYRADTITLDSHKEAFLIRDETSLWNARRLYDLYEEAHTPWDWHASIMQRAEARGMTCFSSPFDFEAVEFLESLDACAYKIASFELTHLPLIRACARTGKPLIMSTGMATPEEISLALSAAYDAGAKNVALLKCTSQYPADARDANLATMDDMRVRFPKTEIGLSDHTPGCGASVAAVMRGATIIEKHFTLRRADGGVDSAFSLEPHELRQLVDVIRKAWEITQAGENVDFDALGMTPEDVERARLAKGRVVYGGTENEEASRRFRPSLWVAKDVKKGEKLTPHNLLIRRPAAGGMEPKEYENALGKTLAQDVEAATPLTKKLLTAQ
ncbi:MAG: pseudaminic acid synthase [Rickettsiales bacterium]